MRPEDLLEANQLCLNDMEPYNHGKVDESATVNSRVGIGEARVGGFNNWCKMVFISFSGLMSVFRGLQMV